MAFLGGVRYSLRASVHRNSLPPPSRREEALIMHRTSPCSRPATPFRHTRRRIYPDRTPRFLLHHFDFFSHLTMTPIVCLSLCFVPNVELCLDSMTKTLRSLGQRVYATAGPGENRRAGTWGGQSRLGLADAHAASNKQDPCDWLVQRATTDHTALMHRPVALDFPLSAGLPPHCACRPAFSHPASPPSAAGVPQRCSSLQKPRPPRHPLGSRQRGQVQQPSLTARRRTRPRVLSPDHVSLPAGATARDAMYVAETKSESEGAPRAQCQCVAERNRRDIPGQPPTPRALLRERT